MSRVVEYKSKVCVCVYVCLFEKNEASSKELLKNNMAINHIRPRTKILTKIIIDVLCYNTLTVVLNNINFLTTFQWGTGNLPKMFHINTHGIKIIII